MIHLNNTQPVKLTEIHSILEKSLRELRGDAKFRDISIQRSYSSDSPLFVEDKGLLIVFQHLYENAVRAMKGAGVLTVATWRQNGSVKVAVQDTGRNAPESAEDGAAGIGLALSAQIAGLCGGTLACDKQSSEETGARFVLTLPRKNRVPF